MREKRDIRPVLLKFGVAVALSLGGILYTILRNKRIKPPKRPPSKGGGEHVDPSLQATPRCRLDQSSQTTPRARPDQPLQNTPRARISGSMAPEMQSSQTTPRGRASASMAPEIQILHSTPRARASSSMAPEKQEDQSVSEGVVDVCCPSTSGRSEGKDDGLLLPEFNDLVREFTLATSKPGFSPGKDVERSEREKEIRSLKDNIKSLKERERNLEIKLLEYYGLKEQETVVMELQNRIKINSMEAKLFSLKIESLKSDKKRLEAQVADYAKVVTELEAAKIKIKQLKKKLRSEAEHSKGQICALQERVMKMHDEEKKALGTLHHHEKKGSIGTELLKTEDFQMEAEELRNSNNTLRIENSELAQRLEYVQILANSVLDDEETEALKAESDRLRKQNEDMAKEIEQLQADRCSDAEELVYLRWVNACLRYELRNYQPDPGKTIARDLSKTLSPKSEEKAKQLILEYAHRQGSAEKMTNRSNSNDFDSDWSSSQASSYQTDSGELDDTSLDNTSSSATQKAAANTSRKRKVFSKLMRLIRGKEKDNSRRLSQDKAPSAEDTSRKYHSQAHGHSPASTSNSGISPVIDVAPDNFNTKSRTSSQGSSRHSFHGTQSSSYQEGVIRKGDDVSPGGGMRRTDSTPASLNNSPQKCFKSDILKYAEALKETRALPSFRRRSASFGSLALP
ncbi:PREDICTED: protein CHUP1, chloroplastic isoform X2 [Ipomoea nil]|uniref:protein CHUP1, chloroplastic isoform X2 n=1 Tax=Ipomoea nil TaxID=35883 RepID=UPI00090095B1|nr:PREDICTED: protein CHUP1, chloroplastic isoform X2 [Ipomoea nil]